MSAALLGVVALPAADLGAVRAGRVPGGTRALALTAAALLLPSAGAVTFSATLAWLLPASAPLLPGYALFALHVLRRRAGTPGTRHGTTGGDRLP